MTANEIKTLREQANAAHDAGDMAGFEALMAKVRAYNVAQAEAFMASAEGKAHMDRLASKFD